MASCTLKLGALKKGRKSGIIISKQLQNSTCHAAKLSWYLRTIIQRQGSDTERHASLIWPNLPLILKKFFLSFCCCVVVGGGDGLLLLLSHFAYRSPSLQSNVVCQ